MRGVVPCRAHAVAVLLGERAHVVERLHRQREPRVAETGGSLDGRLRRAADVDRRVRLLHARWVEREVIEVEELAVVLEVAGRPRGAEDLDRLVEPPTTPPERRPVGVELVRSGSRCRRPRTARPPEIWSSVATCSQIVIGWCSAPRKTPVPSRSRSVRAAIAAEQHERRRRILGLRRERVVTDEAAGEPDRFDVAGELVRPPERVALAGVLEPRQRQAEVDPTGVMPECARRGWPAPAFLTLVQLP